MTVQKIHLIRHAEGYHNLCEANHQLPDPVLTPFGIEQCLTRQRDMADIPNVSAIIASPLRRTIYTAMHIFHPVISPKNLSIIALPELQETSTLPCDAGSDPRDLAREFANHPVDLRLVQEGWNSKTGRWASTPDAIDARAAVARQWLRELASSVEGDVAVVTHGAFLHYLTEDWEHFEKFNGTGWANVEYRSYTFETNIDHRPSLVETAESRERRQVASDPLREAEQHIQRQAALRSWGGAGYQQSNKTVAANL